MIDLDAIQYPVPSHAKPTAFTITYRRHRADRFELRAVTVRLSTGDRIGGWGFAATVAQNQIYFDALDAWLPEQDNREPFRDRLRRFRELFASGWFGSEAR